MKPSRITGLAFAAGFAWVAAGASALADAGPEAAEPLVLRGIMRDLGKRMQTVTHGIAQEDWVLVEETARLIAEHPKPPLLEKTRILGFVGTDLGKFKAHDEDTHQAARALEEAAVRRDGQRAIAAFANLQNSCLACHQAFRKPFVEHFYGQR